MREMPILFSTPMVQAILEGKKTQTRRIIKPQPPDGFRMIEACGIWAWESDGAFVGCSQPKFKIGGKLWVKETYVGILDQENKNRYYYKANSEDEEYIRKLGGIKWHPSLFMPRWASRITLVITDVRVQRLQEITETDAISEGVTWQPHIDTPKMAYQDLWNSINGKKNNWASNPWVWAITFKREAKNG